MTIINFPIQSKAPRPRLRVNLIAENHGIPNKPLIQRIFKEWLGWEPMVDDFLAARVRLSKKPSNVLVGVLIASTDYIECRKAVRELGARGDASVLPDLEQFITHAREEEAKLWVQIENCNNQSAGQAAILANRRWHVLASYLSTLVAIANLSPQGNFPLLFSEFSRVEEELNKCYDIISFVNMNRKELEHNGQVWLREHSIFYQHSGPDSFAKKIQFLNQHLSPPRKRTVQRQMAEDEPYVVELQVMSNTTACDSFRLFNELIVEFFGLPIVRKEETPPACKRLEWINPLARFRGQPLFYKKLADGTELYAVVWPYGHNGWTSAHNPRETYYSFPFLRKIVEQEVPWGSRQQAIYFYYIPASPRQMQNIPLGFCGVLVEQGVPLSDLRDTLSTKLQPGEKKQ